MKRWGIWLIMAVLVVAVAGSGFWGYREYQARQSLQNRAESQYQKSFHELAWHMDMVSGQLAQLLVSSSREQSVLGLATVWRQVFAAQANIGGLPLAYVPLSKTEKLLSDTGEVAFGLLSRVTQSQEGLTEKDNSVIEELYNRSRTLRDELDSLSAKILNQELSWTQAEVAARETNTKVEDNTILDGFQLMERKMEEYPEINLGEDFTQVQPDVKKVRGNQEISLERAKEIAAKWWFAAGKAPEANLSYEGIGDIPTFGLEFPPAQEGIPTVFIDVSKLDGTVIWALEQKDVGQMTLDLSEGERKAQAFLEAHDMGPMTVIKVEQEDNAGVYTFVPRQGEVLLYPDQVKIQVALDNGEVTGYEGTPYYMYHQVRNLPAPVISEEQLKKQISDYLQVELIRPALIANYWGKEILTWEVRGSYQNEKFVIFYNAQTGSEEDITRITPLPKYDFTVTG